MTMNSPRLLDLNNLLNVHLYSKISSVVYNQAAGILSQQCSEGSDS